MGSGRKKLIFAGISLEVCAAFPAITAVGKGLDAYVAVDASGTFSETKRQVGLLRMLQAGVILSDYATLMVEILKDNARPEAGEVYGAMDMAWAKLVGQIAHAHGSNRLAEKAYSCKLTVAPRHQAFVRAAQPISAEHQAPGTVSAPTA